MRLRETFMYLLLGTCLVVLCVTSLHAQALQYSWAERFESKMTPRLESALAELPSDGILEVYAVMKDRLSPGDLIGSVCALPIGERHQLIASRLRSIADQTQERVRSFLSSRNSAAASKPVRVIWLSNAISFFATADEIAAVRGLDEVGYLGLIEDLPPETYQDVGHERSSIFYDGFESGTLGSEWTTATTGPGRIEVTSDHGPIGNFHVTMDSSNPGTYGTCTLTLDIDLSQTPNCYLAFMFKEFGDETHPEDHVSISANGVNFYPIFDLIGSEVYEPKYIDVDAEAASHGIALTSTFAIRFSWRDNFSIGDDGFAFDEISVKEGDAPAIPPTSNIVKLQAPDCWTIGVTGEGVLVLNIDSGTDNTHPDLVNQLWDNPGEAPFGNNGVDDDGNGYIDDFWGWDFMNNDNDPNDGSPSHGTNTSGILCGDGTSGTATGMAPGVTMAVAQVNDQADYWEAQQYAIVIGARAITSSYSYWWGIDNPDYHVFRENCEYELLAGIIHAQSIGNFGESPGYFPIPFNISTPANCPGPWIHPDQAVGGRSSIMGCGGILLDESLYTISSQGPCAWEDMTLYKSTYPYPQNSSYWDYPYGGWGGGQPGLLKPDMCAYTIVTTTEPGGGYVNDFDGTSAAAPHLGGALCLLISANPHASPRKISQALQETAEDKGPAGKDLRYGAGKVQVYDALLRMMHNVEATDPDPSLGDTIDIEVSGVPGDYYALFLSGGTGTTPIPPLGTLDLAYPYFILLVSPIPSGGMTSFPVTIGMDPGLVGAVAYLQGVMKDLDGPTGRYLFSLVERLEVH